MTIVIDLAGCFLEEMSSHLHLFRPTVDKPVWQWLAHRAGFV
jgi:hypothetical protein